MNREQAGSWNESEHNFFDIQVRSGSNLRRKNWPEAFVRFPEIASLSGVQWKWKREITDNQGTGDANQKLSEARAFAVKAWLEKGSPTNFPDGRVRVFAHGMSQPVAPNTTSDGRGKNRRVEIVLGTAE